MRQHDVWERHRQHGRMQFWSKWAHTEGGPGRGWPHWEVDWWALEGKE